MEGHKVFCTAADIAADLSISGEEAVKLVKAMQRNLKAAGTMVMPGKVPAAWYESQKEGGFMDIGQQEERIPLTERRLLSIKDFQEYAGGISDGRARKLVKEIGASVYIGDRLLVDRIRFEEGCTAQNQQARQ